MCARPGARAAVLARAGLAAQLQGDLADLADAGGADRMAHGDQAARGIDRAASADVERAFLQQVHALAFGAEADVLDVVQFLDREGVVQLDDVELLRALAWPRASAMAGGLLGQHCVEADAGGIDALAAADEAATRMARPASMPSRRMPSSDATITAAAPSPTGVHCSDVSEPDDPLAAEHLVERALLLALGVGVFRAVAVVLHRDAGDVLEADALWRMRVFVGQQREMRELRDGVLGEVAEAGAPARRTGLRLSTPIASATSAMPLATSMQAWRNAVEPEADAFSTCISGRPVAPRWRSIGRPDAMPSSAVAT